MRFPGLLCSDSIMRLIMADRSLQGRSYSVVHKQGTAGSFGAFSLGFSSMISSFTLSVVGWSLGSTRSAGEELGSSSFFRLAILRSLHRRSGARFPFFCYV